VTVPSEIDPKTGQPVGLPVTNPAAGPRPGPVTLQGRYGRVERLAQHHDFPTFSKWVGSRPPLEDPYSYAIVEPSGRAVGISTLMEIKPAMRSIEVGHIVYTPRLQRTRLATEAQYLLAKYVFETLGYRRYEWKCNALNAPSWRAALRYGFVYEGLLRQAMIAKGRNRDTAYFSMLDSEWPVRKAAFEQWLAPDNFDGDGRQKTSLAALNAKA
jgi:RimJ/RimL family protein N-acetyltransferase